MKKLIIWIGIIIVVLIRFILSFYTNNYKYKEWKNEKIEVTVINIEKIQEDSITYKVMYDSNFFLLNIKDMNNIYELGDSITALTSNYKIGLQNNPYEFNYKRYLNSNNCVSHLYSTKVLNTNKTRNRLFLIINNVRRYINSKLDKNLDEKNSNIIKSLMYGENALLDAEFKEKCKNIGIGHILCISGTHVAYLLLVFEAITKSKKNNILKIIILIYFYTISIFNISLFRPICMYILHIVDNKLSFKWRICITYVILLIINPYYIFNIGIIFSFLSVMSIRVCYPVISSFFNIKILRNRKNKIASFIIKNVSLTLSAQVLIIPFQVYYFQTISLISIFSNLCLSITLNMLMYIIFFSFYMFFVPGIAQICITLCGLAIDVMVYQVDILDSINIFNIYFPKQSVIVIICYYVVLSIFNYKKIVIIYCWNYRKIAKNVLTIIQYICVIYCIFWYYNTMYFQKYVIYFNVGQGNMALVHNNSTNIIIDIGSTQENNAGNILYNFLKAKNIHNIDLILITHMHSDHINGIETVLEKGINIKSIGYTKPCQNVEEYINLKSKIKEKGIGTIELCQEDSIKIKDIQIDILSPPKNQVIQDVDILNANSTIYLINTMNKNFLFMGDSTKNTERYILNKYIKSQNSKYLDKFKDIYVYQVSHHGSKTSSLEEYIKNINMTHAIISSKKSVYGHPSKEVLDLFEKYNLNTYITEKIGAIIF